VNELLVRFRRDRAKETLADARMLLRDGSPASVPASALFNERFVKVGVVPVEQGRLCANVRLSAEERLRRLRADPA